MKQKANNKIQCPKCNSNKIVKKGIRKNKFQSHQQYQCKQCDNIFTQSIAKNKTYPINLIIKCISLFNLGLSLKEIKQRFKTEASLPTISNWINEFKPITTFSRLRQESKKQFRQEELISSYEFLHNNLNYKFQVHNFKLNYLTNNDEKLSRIKIYLNKIPTKEFPHHILKPIYSRVERDAIPSGRASQSSFKTLNINPLKKQNLANKLCSLALNLAKTNKERHQAIQDFFIANDSTTMATEIPIYLTHDDLLYFSSRNFNLNPNDFSTPVTGHIDILQIRNGLIHILDYKPEANKEQPIEQLTIYALALASKTKLPLTMFKCAWFDENNYYEFFPLHVVKEKK